MSDVVRAIIWVCVGFIVGSIVTYVPERKELDTNDTIGFLVSLVAWPLVLFVIAGEFVVPRIGKWLGPLNTARLFIARLIVHPFLARKELEDIERRQRLVKETQDVMSCYDKLRDKRREIFGLKMESAELQKTIAELRGKIKKERLKKHRKFLVTDWKHSLRSSADEVDLWKRLRMYRRKRADGFLPDMHRNAMRCLFENKQLP